LGLGAIGLVVGIVLAENEPPPRAPLIGKNLFEIASIGMTIAAPSRDAVAKPRYCCVGPSQYMTATIGNVPDG
jgi:hypothetical protein